MSECLILEVVGGRLKGQVHALPVNGTLVIGRLPECGLSIPQDLTVSRQHCRVEFHPPECRLIHLSQTGETKLNDLPVSTANLRTGDLISFGDGNVVLIRHEKSNADVEATVPPGRVDPPRPSESNRLTATVASCGLTVYRSADAEPGFERLLEILCSSEPVFALVDFNRLGQPVPVELAESPYLFSWLSRELRPQFSPMLVAVSAGSIADSIIRSGWRRDGIVCFSSPLKEAELLVHWRNAIGAKEDGPGPSITAYYWPSLLSLMLACQSAQQLAPLLSGLKWLFLESPDSPGQWNLYADEKFASVLKAAGLVFIES